MPAYWFLVDPSSYYKFVLNFAVKLDPENKIIISKKLSLKFVK
tara:strand:- start:12176 stop:12304 length:129 start_codon:yes stop_codon:yes gene_type:complete